MTRIHNANASFFSSPSFFFSYHLPGCVISHNAVVTASSRIIEKDIIKIRNPGYKRYLDYLEKDIGVLMIILKRRLFFLGSHVIK